MFVERGWHVVSDGAFYFYQNARIVI